MTYFVLSANSLEVFTKTQHAVLSFPVEIVRFQEIQDRKKFETVVKEFFSKAKGGEAIFFLAQDVVYSKTIEKKTDTHEEEEAKGFFTKIPFPRDFLAKKVIHLKKQLILLAAYRDYYQTIIHIARIYGWEIKRIVPLTVFQSLFQGKQISYMILSSTLKNKLILDETDFFSEYTLAEEKDIEEQSEDMIPEESEESRSSIRFSMRSQYIVAFVCFLFLVGSIIYAYPILFPTVPSRAAVTPTLTPSAPPIPTTFMIPTSTPSAFLNKATIAIHVLNGSGIAGQATIIKNALSDNGFTHVDTGNAAGGSVTQTSVMFSSQVPPSLQSEVTQILRKSLASVVTAPFASSGAYDVIITTGSPAQ